MKRTDDRGTFFEKRTSFRSSHVYLVGPTFWFCKSVQLPRFIFITVIFGRTPKGCLILGSPRNLKNSTVQKYKTVFLFLNSNKTITFIGIMSITKEGFVYKVSYLANSKD